MGQFHKAILAILVLSSFAGGCVRRVMHVDSDPPGAVVTMNDQEVGRTPFKTDFTWYGRYDVQVRKDGYQTLTTQPMLLAPWWQWPPFDLIAEMMPWHPTDERRLNFTLAPSPAEPGDPGDLLNRAADTRARLESSRHPPSSATGPSTTPME